jgi:TonB family protein
MPRRFGLLGAIYLSLFAHALIMLVLHFVALREEPRKSEAIEITLKSTNNTKQRNIVRFTESENKKMDNSADPLRFLSEKTQRVKEQSRALKTGITQNRSLNLPQNSQQAKNTKEQRNGKNLEKFLPKMTNEIGELARANQATGTPSFQREVGVSTFGNEVSDKIKIGDITSLNTDRYLFYSYYARAEELFRNQWEPLLENMVNRPSVRLLAAPRNRYTTLVEAWFKANGELHSVRVLKESGVPDFDQAAVDAFKRAGLIPNPPKEKIEADGLVRIKWGLSVNFDPRALVRR